MNLLTISANITISATPENVANLTSLFRQILIATVAQKGENNPIGHREYATQVGLSEKTVRERFVEESSIRIGATIDAASIIGIRKGKKYLVYENQRAKREELKLIVKLKSAA